MRANYEGVAIRREFQVLNPLCLCSERLTVYNLSFFVYSQSSVFHTNSNGLFSWVNCYCASPAVIVKILSLRVAGKRLTSCIDCQVKYVCLNLGDWVKQATGAIIAGCYNASHVTLL